jgi:Ca-activated chloride channel homolog
MYFANPIGLLGLLSLPAIAIIHLYHRRFPPRLVAGLHLWGVEVRQPTAGRKRERLPVTPSLLLELLAALVLTLILSQPRFGDMDEVTHLIAVLDNSASMGASGADDVSFRDQAVAQIRSRIEDTTRGSVITIILTGRRPVMLAGPAVEWDVAEAALADWQPTATRHDVLPALDMASQLAESGGEVLFVTDSMPGEKERFQPDVEIVGVGESLSNVAFTAARWTIDSASLNGQIFLRLMNAGPRPAEVNIVGRAGTETVFSSKITLAGGAERSLEAPVPGGLGRVDVRLKSPGDPLAIDNRVTLIEPAIRSVSVANQLPTDSFSGRAFRRVLDALPDLRSASGTTAHLVIASGGEMPESRRDLWWLGVGPLDSAEPARKAARDLLGPYLVEKRHALLDGILLSGVVWAGVQPVKIGVAPLISAGSEKLLSQLDGTESTAFLLNIDLQRSNLTESPDWPILLSNLIELRRESLPGLRRWNYRLNEDIVFRLFEGTFEMEATSNRPLTLKSKNDSRVLARSAIVEVPPLDDAGVYTVLDGDEPFGEFAVNYFDLEESTLTNLRSGHRPAVVEEEDTRFEIDDPYTWLILLGLPLIILLAFADWFILRPRRA